MYTVIDVVDARNIDEFVVYEGREGVEAVKEEFLYRPHILTAVWKENRTKQMHFSVTILIYTRELQQKGNVNTSFEGGEYLVLRMKRTTALRDEKLLHEKHIYKRIS